MLYEQVFFILVVVIFFTACDKENNPNIESKDVAIVKAKIDNFEIASIKYENGELELDELSFSTTIPDNYLVLLFKNKKVQKICLYD